jgi:probable HAF family extracellular repeat protein
MGRKTARCRSHDVLGTLKPLRREGYPIMKSQMRKILFTLTSCLTLALSAFTPTQAQVYAITDLGALPGETSSMAYNLNDSGQVVGQSGLYGFLWNNGTMTELILPGGVLSVAQGISPGGAVVGASHPLNDHTHAFMYSGGTMYDLHRLLLGGEQNSSYANDINSWGQIVGGAFTPADQFHAYIRDPLSGHTYDLGTLGGFASQAFAINFRSEVVGSAYTPAGQNHAFFWNVSGGMADLGALGGYYRNSYAHDINDQTQIVGTSETATGTTHAFLKHPSSAMLDLGTLGGTTSAALGINNAGRVVGEAALANGMTHAFLYLPNPYIAPIDGGVYTRALAARSLVFGAFGMRDLNTLLPANSGWTLTSAQAINNKGQIAGYGIHNGYGRAFLMTPLAIGSLTLSPSTLAGGNHSFGTIALNDVTPVDITVLLSNTNPAATAPTSVVIPAGASSASFVLTTTPVTSATTGTITATYNGSQSATITVRPPILRSLALSSYAVRGGTPLQGGVLLDGPAPASMTVALASSKPTVAYPAVSQVVISAGSKSATFTVNTRAVLATTNVVLSATLNRITKTAVLRVTPLLLSR